MSKIDNIYDEQWDTLLSDNDLKAFSKLLDDPTQSYKFYWLESLVKLHIHNFELTFEAIINEMIYNSWHSVSSYHIHLGPFINGKPSSFLEMAVNEIQSRLNIQYGDSPEKIKNAIAGDSKELSLIRNQLAKNVPYRILSPFLGLEGNDPIWNSQKQIIKRINNSANTLYKIIDKPKLQKVVWIEQKWDSFLKKNSALILGWIQFKKIKYLQARNPGVPSIPSKLEAPTQRKNLEYVRNLWKYVASKKKIIDIYTGEEVDMEKSDVDHFIPWTYVCCDELWNLVPTNNSMNRSKSNNLPDWDLYFNRFAENQFILFETVLEDKKAKMLFDKCKINNVLSIWATDLLYSGSRDKNCFITILQENMKPIYDSAKYLGYNIWNKSQYKGYHN